MITRNDLGLLRELLATVLILALLTWVSGRSVCAQTRVDNTFLLGATPVFDEDVPLLASSLKGHGINTISFTTFSTHEDWRQADFTAPEQDTKTIQAMRTAQREGFTTVFVPRVKLNGAVGGNRFLWHGMIAPADTVLDAWFSKYESFLVSQAQVCEREGVSLLAIGSELSELTSTRTLADIPKLQAEFLRLPKGAPPNTATRVHRDWAAATTFADPRSGVPDISKINERRKWLDARWRRLIIKVREVFSGKLTYAANFDQYQEVGFWDALDVVAINAYFEIRPNEPVAGREALGSILESGWRKVFQDIETFQGEQRLKLPLVFTELGYTQRAGCTVYPWDYSGDRAVDASIAGPIERVVALEALGRTARKYQTTVPLAGVFYWRVGRDAKAREFEPYAVLPDDPDDAAVFRALRSLNASPQLARSIAR